MYWLSQFGQLSKSFSSCWDLYENKSKMQRVVTVASPERFQLVWANPSVLRGKNLLTQISYEKWQSSLFYVFLPTNIFTCPAQPGACLGESLGQNFFGTLFPLFPLLPTSSRSFVLFTQISLPSSSISWILMVL